MDISSLRNSTALKAVGLFAALAMVFSVAFASTSARAQTTAELEAQIAELLELIADLQSQVDGGATSDGVAFDHTFTMDLSLGSTGPEVMRLQEFLNEAGVQVAPAGSPGSAGNETSYYGPATAAAVSDFQEKYAADILTPVGLSVGTGYWGPSSRAKANALIAVMNSGDDVDDEGDDEGDDDGDLEGGEAAIQDFDLSAEGDAAEGEEEAEVATIEYEVVGGDVELNRLDLLVTLTGNTEDDPEDIFEEIVLLADGEEIGSIDASVEDYWSLEATDTYSIRLSGLDYVTRMGDNANITVAVSMNDSITAAGAGDTTADVVVNVPADGARFVDAAGLVQYAPATASDAVTFDITAEGADDSLAVSASNEDPDATTFEVSDSGVSEEHTVFAFEMETGDNDVTIDEIPLTVTTATENYDDIVDSAMLVINGEEFDDVSVADGNTTTADLTFSLDDFELEGDTEYVVELVLVFEDSDGYTAGTTTVQGSVTGTNLEAEGADEFAATGGAVTGAAHTLDLSGTTVEDEGGTSSTQSDSSVGKFVFNLGVLAFGDDVTGIDATDFTVTNTEDGGASILTPSVTLSASGDGVTETATGVYTVDEGATASMTLTVFLNADTAGTDETGVYVVDVTQLLGDAIDVESLSEYLVDDTA